MSSWIRILLLADTHLGFDLPERPRVKRRRRGHDFLANYAAALEPARRGEVDVVVHAGDVFDMPGVSTSVAYQALEPLRRLAESGVPVVIVPGNHERSRLPHDRFAAHPRVHVFDRPRLFRLEVRGRVVAFAGFPFVRGDVRSAFPGLVAGTGWRPDVADASVLCVHQAVEGARVGPVDFTFRNGVDVVRGRDIPAGFAAVLSGHIHRHQVLASDLGGRALAAPVLYPGSIERTALAEMGEPKGYMVVRVRCAAGDPAVAEPGGGDPRAAADGSDPPNVAPDGGGMPGTESRGGVLPGAAADGDDLPNEGPVGLARPGAAGAAAATWEFRPLPARPMIVRVVACDGLGPGPLEAAVRAIVAEVPADAVLTLRLKGASADGLRGLSAARLRAFVPETMNVEVQPEGRGWRGYRGGDSARDPSRGTRRSSW